MELVKTSSVETRPWSSSPRLLIWTPSDIAYNLGRTEHTLAAVARYLRYTIFITLDVRGLICDPVLISLKLNWPVIYHWRRQSYFSRRTSKSGHWLGVHLYVMVDFICMGLLELQWARAKTENYKFKWKILASSRTKTHYLRLQGWRFSRLKYSGSVC